jgi:hypothetical protein
VTAVGAHSVTLLGVTVDTTGFTFGGGSESAFYAAVHVGIVVAVTGTMANGVVTWNAIKIDD